MDDPILGRAILRSLEIIGEASKKIDMTIRNEYPEISWKNIAGTRDRLIHHYFAVDNDIVWDIIQNNLSELQTAVIQILAKEDKNISGS